MDQENGEVVLTTNNTDTNLNFLTIWHLIITIIIIMKSSNHLSNVGMLTIKVHWESSSAITHQWLTMDNALCSALKGSKTKQDLTFSDILWLEQTPKLALSTKPIYFHSLFEPKCFQSPGNIHLQDVVVVFLGKGLSPPLFFCLILFLFLIYAILLYFTCSKLS